MPSTQLVGQTCVICGKRIGNELDARFCPACRCPVHTACTAERVTDDTDCPTCHAPAAVAEQPRRAVAEEAAVAGRSGRSQIGGCVLVMGVLMSGSAAMTVARNLDNGIADLLNAAIGLVLGLAVIAFRIATLSRSAK